MKTESYTEITIIMTEEEALWLKAIMQNPLFVRYKQDEEPIDTKMRQSFFYALKGELGDNP